MKFALPISSLIQRVQTSSVIAPLLALDIIVGLLALAMSAVLGETKLVYGICLAFGLCVATTIVAYIYWSFASPDRLQSENYMLEQKRIGLLGDERDPNNPRTIEARATSNTVIE